MCLVMPGLDSIEQSISIIPESSWAGLETRASLAWMGGGAAFGSVGLSQSGGHWHLMVEDLSGFTRIVYTPTPSKE